MAKALGSGIGRYGTSQAVKAVDRTLLGTKRYPIVIEQGEKEETGEWHASIRELPGYLGVGEDPTSAFDSLAASIAREPTIYDVSRCRNLDPSTANIRGFVAQIRTVAEAVSNLEEDNEKLENATAATLTNYGKRGGVSRHSLDAARQSRQKWAKMGGVERGLQTMLGNNASKAIDLLNGDWCDLISYMEDHPNRSRAALARSKFP